MLLFLLVFSAAVAQETTEEMKVRANKLFEEEQYVEATPLYLHLLSLEPKEVEWNFKYGACLLYNSNNKSDALRYLKFGVNNDANDSRVDYFYGRALHLDYQFDAAKKFYQKYQNERSKADKRYPVEREIRMCENGKHLLTNFTDIVVTSKKQISEDRFYDIYSDSKTIGGQIIVQSEYQSKIDKKKGHIPTVHIAPEAKMIFYSSYGDNENTGLDIYMRRKLPNGKWSEAQLVPGGVNTAEDEEYPFMHASGKFLYFSSKGHNSMGGYDVFMSRYDAENNTFGPAENVDFAISSTDDDLFYVVDENFENAYFASGRSSESGKLHVYKVKVARIPLQEVIVMGDFISEVNPTDQKVTIKITKHSNNAELETMRADASKGGKYSYVFPQGGKYDYLIEVEGTGDQYKFTIDLPHLDELRPLKQQIVHTTENGKEIIRLINKFDETAEGAEALIAQVIRKKSELEVNVNDVNLEDIQAEKQREELLATLGYNDMSTQEVTDQLANLTEEVTNNEEVTERILSNISSELVAKADRVKELDQMEQELRANAEKVADPIAKHKLLQEASQKQREKEALLAQIDGLEALLEDVNNLADGGGDPAKIQAINDKYTELVSSDQELEALQYLVAEKETLDAAKESSPTGVRQKIVDESLDIRERIRSLRENKSEYERSISAIEARITILEREREAAKKKDLERIDSDIASAQEELRMTKDEIESVTAQIADLEFKLNKTEEQLASLQNAMSTEEKSDVSINEALDAGKEVEEIAEETPYDYEAELAQLEADHPEINGGDPIADWSSQISEEYSNSVNAIERDTDLSELERTSRTLDENEKAIRSIDQRLSYIDEQPSNPRLDEQKAALQKQREALASEQETLREREKELKLETPDAALTKEDVLAEVAPDFETDLSNAVSNFPGDERGSLEEQVKLRDELAETIQDQLDVLEMVLEQKPEDEEAIARRELLLQLQEENNANLETARNELAQLPEDVANVTSEDVINELVSDYQAKKEEIANSNGTPVEKEEALLQENIALKNTLEKEAATLDKQLRKTPDDQELQARKEAVNEAQSMIDAEIAERNQTIAALNGSSTVANVTEEEIVRDALPDYEARSEQINQSDATPLEKEQQRLALENDLQKSLTKEVKQLDKELKKDPENPEVQARLEAANSALTQSEQRESSAQDQIAALENTPPQNTVSSEQVLTEIAPDFERTVEEIRANESSELEQEQAVLQANEDLLKTIQEESNSVDEALNSNPGDTDAQARKAALNELKGRTESNIEQSNARIQQLEQGPNVTAQTSEELINELNATHGDDLAAIETADLSPAEKARRKAMVQAGLLETLKEEQNRLEKELKRDADNSELQDRLALVNVTTSETEAEVQQLVREAATSQTVVEKDALLADIAPSYEQELTDASTPEEIIAAEQRLQETLEAEIAQREKTLKRSYSVSVEIEKVQMEQLLEESKMREAAVEQPQASNENDFIASVRENAGSNVEEALAGNETTRASLEKQDAVLASYEQELDTKIEEQEARVADDPSEENKDQLNWLVAEKERVAKKRRSIQISIGELEQEVVVNTNSSDPEVQRLIEEEQEIRTALKAEDLSISERKELNRQLSDVTEERYERENETVAGTIEQQQEETQQLKEALVQVESDQNTAVASRVMQYADEEEKQIAAIEQEAEEANSEAERNYLLNQAQQRRERLNDEMQEAVTDAKLQELEENYEIETASESELERKKRKYTIEIGEVSREIERVDRELADAKRKEIPTLEAERVELVARKEKLQAQLDRVNDQLTKVEHTPEAVNENALEAPISFNEEREIASSEEYAAYQEAAIEALSVANEIRTLEEELSAERLSLQRMVRNGSNEEDVALKAKEIKALEEKIDQKRIELTQKKYLADQALPADEDEAMKMQNLVARGIQPLKLTVAAAALIQMPSTGFAIDTSASRPNNGAIEIPIGVEHPEGLVYRVQVGAFARPLRDDVFREFNPVSGEKIEGTNITRYMAGYFNSSESVVDAREQIRSLGYSDAFVVAYCNGERITLGEARRREAAGICVPKREEEILIEVAENTAKTLNIPVVAELEEVPEWSYNQAPGAADADPIEKMEGLFFTVQVGVFNRPVSSADIKNMPNVFTFRLPNGQIRYNTGMFDSAEEAVPRQNFARQSGIVGAFIVAYYKGERISIANARRLLNQLGDGILQSRIDSAPEVEKVDVVRTDSVTTEVVELAPMEEWEMRVQIVTEKTFDEFPRDVLNRYNAEGAFYYDEKDKKVKSVIYKNEEYLPNLFNFHDDIDTVYIEEGLLDDQKTDVVEVIFADSVIPGDFMDWMLRCNYRREMLKSYKGAVVHIYGVPEAEIEGFIERIRVFGVEPNRIAETEENDE